MTSLLFCRCEPTVVEIWDGLLAPVILVPGAPEGAKGYGDPCLGGPDFEYEAEKRAGV